MRTGRTRGRSAERFLGVAALLLMVSAFSSLSAYAAEALVRTGLATAGDIWVGQRVTVVIELLSPGFFAGSPAFDLPSVPGVIIGPPDERAVVGTETIGDVRYAVQRHELAVYAQRAGRVEIPRCGVRFATREGAAAPIDHCLQTDAVAFDALLPPGAEGLAALISARELQATETWRPEPGKAKVGDAFTRTIVFGAPDIPAMVFPPLPAAAVDGLGIYPKTPQVRDGNDRGRRRGERTETIVYVCQRPGRVRIPAMKLTWWDLDDRQLKVAEFPARAFDIAPNPAFASAAPAARDGRKILNTTAGCGFVGLALAGGAWLTRKQWPAWRRRTAAYWSPVHLAPLNPLDPDRGE